MSGDSTPWLPPITVDQAVPPGGIILRGAAEQGIIATEATHVAARTSVSERLAEDCRSLIESAPYFIRYREGGHEIICECCGTLVAQMPERLVSAGRDGPWTLAVWEPVAGRKHTQRRCEWTRNRKEPAP